MRHQKKVIAAGILSASISGPAAAESLQEWLSGDYATGDWGGLRTQLQDSGVTINGGYTTDIMALVRGGESGGEGWDYAGRLGVGIDFDLEKLLGVAGGGLYASASWSSGTGLSEKQVGNSFAVQQIFTGQSVRLNQLYYSQRLLEDAVTLKIGRLTAESDFLASDIYTFYVNGGINGAPSPIPDSNPGFTTEPVAQWGFVADYQASEQVRVAAGFYNGDEKVGEDKRHGVDFSFDPGDNMLAIAEVDYSWSELNASDGLAGLAKFGALFETGNRDELPDGESSRKGNYGFYASIEQKVYAEADDPEQGLTPWAVVTYQPRQSVAELPVFVGAGLVYVGLLPGRDTDSTAIGVFHGVFSDRIDDASSETVVEVNYGLRLTPWFYVAPDVQFILNPSGDADIDDAIVVGGEIGITF